MRCAIASLMILLLASAEGTVAQVQVGGYFEPQLMGVYLDGHAYQLNSNKLRVDVSSDLTERISFAGNFNYINYNGRKQWNLLDFVPDKLSAGVPDSLKFLYEYEYNDEDELDNAWLRMSSDVFTLTVGKQQLSVGSGYVWNPTDLFNLKDIIDPTYEQPGVNGVRVDVGLSDVHTLSLFYSPEDDFDNSGKLVRFQGTISHFDYALTAGEKTLQCTDFETFLPYDDKKGMLGFDVNGELLGLGCWSENAYVFMKNSRDYWENVFGVDYTLSSGWYIMAEYYRNERGKSDHDKYTLADWVRYFNAETKALSRDQVYAYTVYPLTDFIDVGGSVGVSASDGSLVLVPTVEYSLSGNLMVTVFGSLYTGTEGTTYSADLGSGGLVRLRAYF